MNANEALRELERRGTEQNCKIFRRHGADANLYGVSYADFKTLKKSIKLDQPLAEALWVSGNHDARVLATMIADPRLASSETLNRWANDLTNSILGDALAGLAASTPEALTLMDQWMTSEREWVAASGWSILAHLAKDRQDLDASFWETHLKTIARSIHSAPNRVRHSMNGALIALGLRGGDLQDLVVAVATRIGKVKVDHGETGCKTPDALAYIAKATRRKA